jgi:FMN phosphatase YigB (HAD superfamily)
VRGVVFDLSGTLAHGPLGSPHALAALAGRLARRRGPAVAARVAEAFTELLRAYAATVRRRRAEVPAERMLAAAFRRCDLPLPGPDEAAELLAPFAECPGWGLLPGAATALDALRRSGLPLVLFSNDAFACRVHGVVDRLGLRPWFQDVRSSAEVGFRKPDPRALAAALAALGCAAGEVAVVGDRLTADVAVARRLGARALWLRAVPHPENASVPCPPAPDAVADTLPAAVPILLRWGGCLR